MRVEWTVQKEWKPLPLEVVLGTEKRDHEEDVAAPEPSESDWVESEAALVWAE